MNLKDLLQYLNNESWIKKLLEYSDVYVVGGVVRDLISGRKTKDIDLLVDKLPINIITHVLKDYGKVDTVGQSFQVVKFKPIGHVGEPYDIAVPRKDKKIGTGHKGFEVITDNVSVNDDLKRRDFTLNSIAVNIRTAEIIDPFNGLQDLKDKILRATDVNAFAEDPLRMLRAIQFAARFDLQIEDETFKLIKQHARLLSDIPGERVIDEFSKVLNGNGDTIKVFQLLYDTDLDTGLFGRKLMLPEYFTKFKDLDEVSFFYLLGSLGGFKPSHYFKGRLAGESYIEKALKLLEQYLDVLESIEEEELRYIMFKMIMSSKVIEDVKILPGRAINVIKLMNDEKIPKYSKDIATNGNIVMETLNVKGTELGKILERLYKDALMNRFNWKNESETIEHLKTYN